MNFKLIAALAAVLSTAPAFSAPVTLDFQGAGEYTLINDFYNGGVNEEGVSGTNFGVSFGPDALALSNNEDFSYYSNAPTPGIMSAVGPEAALNASIGFAGTASFYYSSVENTSVSIFSGLNGTGDLLGTFSLLANAQSGCDDSPFCNWDMASLDFAGVAQSIQFGNTAGLAGFDNVTIAPVPLPAAGWLMMSALGGLGALVRRKRAV